MTGTYTEITEIAAPGSAVAGSSVSIQVKIKNKHSSTIGIMVAGALEYGVTPWPSISFPSYWANVAPGATYTFYGSFTMPSSSVTIHAYSYYYGTDGYWHFDDERTKAVSLGEVFKGTISRKEIEYDAARAFVPASNIPQGKSGLLHIWGRNDMTTTQQMGISWTLTDPTGAVRESYSTWEAYPYTSPGGEHEFIGGRFSLDKVGTWMINVLLYMNPSSPTIVDSYYGTLCTVVSAVPEPTVSQFEIKDYIKV